MKISWEKLIIFTFGASVAAYSLSFKGGENWVVSPALFCVVCGVLICILSLFLKNEKNTNFQNTQRDKKEFLNNLVNPALFVLSVLIYSFALGKVHFVLLTFGLLLVLGIIAGRENLADNVIQSVLIAFVIYFVFGTLFKVHL